MSLAINQLTSFAASENFFEAGADFDGSSYLRRVGGLTGAVDSKLFVFSTWFRLDGGNGTDMLIFSGTATLASTDFRFYVVRTSVNTLACVGYNAAGAVILNLNTGFNTFTSGASWRHVAISCDMADTGKRHLYVNNTDMMSVVTYTNDTIDFTLGDWAVGAVPDGTLDFNGALAGTYFRIGEYLQLSSADVRHRFLTTAGAPVDLGEDGKNPTGTVPEVYLHLRQNEAVSGFKANRGTGGALTETGTLTYASSHPSP